MTMKPCRTLTTMPTMRTRVRFFSRILSHREHPSSSDQAALTRRLAWSPLAEYFDDDEYAPSVGSDGTAGAYLGSDDEEGDREHNQQRTAKGGGEGAAAGAGAGGGPECAGVSESDGAAMEDGAGSDGGEAQEAGADGEAAAAAAPERADDGGGEGGGGPPRQIRGVFVTGKGTWGAQFSCSKKLECGQPPSLCLASLPCPALSHSGCSL